MIRSLTSHALSPCNQTAYWKQMVLHNCKICSSLWLHYDENMRVLLFAAWQCTTPIYYNYCCCCCCCSFFAGVSTELENATMESRSKSQNRRLILARATFFSLSVLSVPKTARTSWFASSRQIYTYPPKTTNEFACQCKENSQVFPYLAPYFGSNVCRCLHIPQSIRECQRNICVYAL